MRDAEVDGFATVTCDGASVTAVVDPAFARRATRGHFPGAPLLPGSALLALMSATAARLARPHDRLAGVERAVFRRRVHPADRIVVRARRAGVGHVTATVHADDVEAATARLRFEPGA